MFQEMIKDFIGEDGKCDPEKIKQFMSNMGCCPTDSDKGCGCGETKEEETQEEGKK